VSKNLQLINTFKDCLGLTVKVSKKRSGFVNNNYVYFVQFGDVNFYRFLVSIGLTPYKSKTLGALKIPNKYFIDFLGGSFDGDGTSYAYWDKRWASSYMYYLVFVSASLEHLKWIRRKLRSLFKVKGHFNLSLRAVAYQLKYARSEAQKVVTKMYRSPDAPRLERKFKKVYTSLVLDRNNR